MPVITKLPLAALLILPALVFATGGEDNPMPQNRIDIQRPDAPALAAYGDYEVGTQPLSLSHPDQVDVLALDAASDAPAELPTTQRNLTVQLWYPAFPGAEGSNALRVFLRDGTTEVDVHGKATLWAAPVMSGGPFPLVIVSHGYPGNRFLLSHLAENIASKGYIVASIDHLDSTYRTQAAFGSTLRNRSLDQIFVLNEMARLNGDADSFLHGLVDTDNTALMGYSMGGYGAVITAGGGVTAASVAYPFSPPHGTLAVHQSGSDTHRALTDARIKTAIAFAPWGRNFGFFDAETSKGIQIPMLYVAGTHDDVSQYEGGVRSLWEESLNIDRALLTLENANHNAGAPMPAPVESYAFNAELGYAPFEHYADAVWDSVRMNNIAQHFSTAWLDYHLKNDSAKFEYLDLVPDAHDGVYDVADDGTFGESHSYWKGFQDRTAKGLRFEWLEAGESATVEEEPAE